jgi:hypothetical protein
MFTSISCLFNPPWSTGNYTLNAPRDRCLRGHADGCNDDSSVMLDSLKVGSEADRLRATEREDLSKIT